MLPHEPVASESEDNISMIKFRCKLNINMTRGDMLQCGSLSISMRHIGQFRVNELTGHRPALIDDEQLHLSCIDYVKTIIQSH